MLINLCYIILMWHYYLHYYIVCYNISSNTICSHVFLHLFFLYQCCVQVLLYFFMYPQTHPRQTCLAPPPEYPCATLLAFFVFGCKCVIWHLDAFDYMYELWTRIICPNSCPPNYNMPHQLKE